MIWLLSNLWWLVPALFALVALGFVFAGPGLPVLLALLRRVPVAAWAVLGGIALVGLAFQGGRWYERSQVADAQAAAEKKADVRADKVAGKATAKADAAKADIRKDSDNAQTEVRTIIRTLPASCPELPPRAILIGKEAVEKARNAGEYPP